MACSDCDSIRREYILFRKTVTRFGKLLDQLEAERERLELARRPHNPANTVSAADRSADGEFA